MEEIESYSREYKKKLEEIGASGDIPSNLALEVTKTFSSQIGFIYGLTIEKLVKWFSLSPSLSFQGVIAKCRASSEGTR